MFLVEPILRLREDQITNKSDMIILNYMYDLSEIVQLNKVLKKRQRLRFAISVCLYVITIEHK